MSTIFKTIEPEESGKIIYERHPEWKFNKEQRLYEKVISDTCSFDVAVFGSNAIRVFPVGEILVDTGVWCDGIPILSGA